MFEVIYYSRTENTKKIAEVIAEELGVTAEDVKTKKELAKDSFALLGSGCYGGKPGKEMEDFIGRQDFSGRKVALFGTSASSKGQEVAALEAMVMAKGAKVIGKFYCSGKFIAFINRKNPTSKELEDARNFAREMKKA